MSELDIKMEELNILYEDSVLSDSFDVWVSNLEMFEVVRDFLAELHNRFPEAKVGQIKEKFGQLRIYLYVVKDAEWQEDAHKLAYKYEGIYNNSRKN